MLFIFSPLCWTTHSTRLLWWGYSQGTPNTVASLETQNMPSRPYLSKGKKRERKGWRKGENSLVANCIFLSLWFPSTVNVNKQSHERGKHGQKGEKKKNRGGGGGGRKHSASKNILAHCVRYKSPAHLLVSLQMQRQKTHAGNNNAACRHSSTQRESLWTVDTLQRKFVVQ